MLNCNGPVDSVEGSSLFEGLKFELECGSWKRILTHLLRNMGFLFILNVYANHVCKYLVKYVKYVQINY